MDEPIAIVGLDARLPGDGDTAEKFYESLLAGRSARTEIPPERYNVDAFWHPHAERIGATRTREAHFLRGSISAFDAPFFSITPTEAHSMDPQQRGMLESVYKALENAGIPLAKVTGSQTGVYVGCFTYDYNDITVKDLDALSMYAATGTVASILSNRVSWFFDFRGPSMTIDTACSSSLVAAHEACMSLKLREINMAIVGGCNLILTPEMTLKLDAAGVLGPDGKSYSFDHRGNGYSRGEGFGVLVLKRMSDAIRDGDTIRAVIRNSSSNQDGRSPGITQPTKAGQAQLIRHVYSRAGLDPSLTRFFEAHGTGTKVGDPIEAGAISEIFTPYRSPDQPLYVGALKSNVGHLEGAAGVAAMIKGVFTLERGVIPGNIWFEKLNPNIDESWNLKFPTEPTVWPQAGLRRMSINSFGIGGSNAHVVMDDAYHFLQQYHLIGSHRTVIHPKKPVLDFPAVNGTSHKVTNGVTNGLSNGLTNGVTNGHPNGLTNGTTNGVSIGQINGVHESSENGGDAEIQEVGPEKASQLIVLSSYDQDGVKRVQSSYKDYIASKRSRHERLLDEETFLKDLTYTLASKRTHHAWRSFSTASTPYLQKALSEISPPVRAKSDPRLAFVFTGQGAQWPNMGIELLAYPVFQRSLLAADKYLNSIGCSWSLTYELAKDGGASRIDNPEFCQPICTALQMALADLLAAWNIRPDAITGHSSGEVAGAYAAGAISQEAAWKISYYRGKFSAKLANAENGPKTGMAAVGLNIEDTQAAIDRINQTGGEGTLEIACMNSWQSHTVSGDANKINSLVETLSSEKVFARKLNVEMAYHSQYMRAMATEYLEAMGTLEPGSSETTPGPQFFSSTYGAAIPKSKLQQAEYWVENLVSPVRFCHSVTALLSRPAAATKTNGYREDRTASPTITDILEIGPHSALKGPLSNIAKQCQGVSVDYHSVLVRKQSGIESALGAAGSLFCRGFDVELSHVNELSENSGYRPQMLTDLPSYPFNHSKEYWLESRISKNFRTRPVPRHELLGAPVSDWSIENAIWRNHIRISENPWIEDHKVSGDILYPAAGMLVMAIEASRQVSDTSKVLKGFRFKDVSIHAALRVPDDPQGVESHFYLRPYRESSIPTASKWHEFQLMTFEKSEWREHCYGLIQTEYETEYTPVDGGLEEQMLQERFAEGLRNAETGCATEVPVEDVYQNLQEAGLEFGPTFQSLSNVRLGPSFELLAKVESPLPRIEALMPHGYVQPHLVHPATLDGILQANIASLVSNPDGSRDTRVPVHVEELWVAAGPRASHDSYLVSVAPKLLERNEVECSVAAFNFDTRQILVHASGLLFKTIPRSSSQEAGQSTRKGAFNVEWKPDPTLLDEAQSSHVFALPMSPDVDPSDWMIECETLCILYIRRFLESVSQETRDKMDWFHKKYVEWMEHVVQTTPLGAGLTDVNSLEEKVLDRGVPEGKLIIAVGQALNEILGGTRDPLEVIFGNNLAENVYRNGLGSERCYLQLCNYIDALVHKNPTMQMLEIGAGTGGATRPIMQTLTKHGQRYQHYTFTDISPSFFEHARENFSGQLGSMSFKVLNVENDPLEQGFEAGTYDLIVAANVLHATKKIDVSLSNARKLLKPGGKLLLYEITNTDIILSSFCFGVLPGWWLSEDADRRWGPLMPADTWRSHLIASGFTGLDGVFDDFPGSKYQVSSILVSGVSPVAPASAISPVYIMVDAASALQKEVADGLLGLLSERGPCEIVTIENVPVDINGTTFLVLAELDAPILQNVAESTFQIMKRLTNDCKNIIWLTRGGVSSNAAPDLELSQGLARVARLENEDLDFVNLSFDGNADATIIIEKCKQTALANQDQRENSIRIINGIPHVPRLVKAEYLMKHVQTQTGSLEVVQQQFAADPTRSLALQIENLGQLDTLRFEDDPLSNKPLEDDEVEFKPMACGINFRDLASALGKIEEPAFGLEAAGIVTRTGPNSQFAVGDRVFGLSFLGVIKTLARSSDGFLAQIPESMSWAEAASIPIVYTTAYAVLFETGTVRKGDTVLIHSAAGGFGQAAIQLAQHQGAEVFVTVGNNEKREFLEATYGIPRDHIFSSRDLSFKLGIQRLTGGRGVDLVLNSLAGEALRATWDCVAPFGRFVELGVADINSNTRISMGNFVRNTRFEAFELAYRAVHDPIRTHAMFQRMVALVIHGSAAPGRKTPIKTYPLSQIQGLFRQMQSGTHIGKLVLEPHDEDVVPVISSQKPKSQFDANASYVIAGGLGGLGRSVARWMASRGAKNLILLSRRGAAHPSAIDFIKELESICDKVSAPPCDVTDEETLKKVINECLSHMPPIKGCVQGSMVLKDNRLEHMSLEEWNEAVRSKVQASWNLHNVLGRDLDFMVLLSSMIGVTGNPEQANYAAGGAFQDALAHHLASQGLNVVCLDLPVVRGVGFVAEKPGLMEYMQSTGWAFMEENELHAVLDYHCRPLSEPAPISNAQVIPRFWLPQETASEGYQLPAWKDDLIFSHLTQTEKSAEETGEAKKEVNHAALLGVASSIEEAEKIVLEALLLKISRVTSVEIETLDPAKPLHAYGVDSLVAVELRSWLSKELRADVSVFDMTNKSSIYQLASTTTERSKLTPKFE